MKARWWRLVLLPLVAVILTACKLRIIVPEEGGIVVWGEGESCQAGDICNIDVSDQNFDETFRAVPDAGYRFVGWRRMERSFCGGKDGDCHLFTTTFNDNPNLVRFLDSPTDVFRLRPEFEPVAGYDPAFWQALVAEFLVGNIIPIDVDYLYASQPNAEMCDPGILNAEPGERALETLNQVRALLGLPTVAANAENDLVIQRIALIQATNAERWGGLRRDVSGSDACYDASVDDIIEGSALSAWAVPIDPARDVVTWLTGQFDAKAQIMRRLAISPYLTRSSYGQVNNFGSLDLLPDTADLDPASQPFPEELEFVAYPSGNFPFLLMTPLGQDYLIPNQPSNDLRWSITWVADDAGRQRHRFFRNARVSVAHRDTEEQLTVRGLYQEGTVLPLNNVLNWRVDNWQFDEPYIVTISDVEMEDGSIREIQYPVTIDRFPLVDELITHDPAEAGDSRSSQAVRGRFNSQTDSDSFAVELDGNWAFQETGDIGGRDSSGTVKLGYFLRIWDTRKQLLLETDQPVGIGFPAGLYTLVLSPCSLAGACYVLEGRPDEYSLEWARFE